MSTLFDLCRQRGKAGFLMRAGIHAAAELSLLQHKVKLSLE